MALSSLLETSRRWSTRPVVHQAPRRARAPSSPPSTTRHEVPPPRRARALRPHRRALLRSSCSRELRADEDMDEVGWICAEGQSSPARVKSAPPARAELTGPLRRPPLLLPPAGDPGDGRRRLLPPVHHTARAPPQHIPAAASSPPRPPASSGRVAPVGHRGAQQLLRMGLRGQPMEKGRRSRTQSGGSYDFQLPPSGRAPVTGNPTASLPNPFFRPLWHGSAQNSFGSRWRSRAKRTLIKLHTISIGYSPT
jgi:hypothetical protein